jgi:hypothetical protein
MRTNVPTTDDLSAYVGGDPQAFTFEQLFQGFLVTKVGDTWKDTEDGGDNVVVRDHVGGEWRWYQC